MAGFIIYRGPSLLDGKPIVVIANGFGNPLGNRKTGVAIQTYILRSDIGPNAAAESGEDVSICGDCPLRPSVSGVCYVEIGKGVWHTWQAFQRGDYGAHPINRAEFRHWFPGWLVRLGAYGDPAAAPFDLWADVTASAGNWTGYTHQWRTCDQRLRSLLMASVEKEKDASEAHKKGWRTFRMRRAADEILAGEITCPSSDEGGNRRQCVSCKACRGASHVGQSSVAIIVHGQPWKAQRLEML